MILVSLVVAKVWLVWVRPLSDAIPVSTRQLPDGRRIQPLVRVIPFAKVLVLCVVSCPTFRFDVVAFVISTVPRVDDALFKSWMVEDARLMSAPAKV